MILLRRHFFPAQSHLIRRGRKHHKWVSGTITTEPGTQVGDLETAARIAGHESTRTTQLYNRVHEELSLDEIERIHL